MSEDTSASEPQPKSKPEAGTDPRKETAKVLWERLAKSRPGPDNKDLMFLSRFVPLLSKSAVKTLLNRKLTMEELKELIQHVPMAKEAATKLALKQYADDISEEDLRFIFSQTRYPDVGRLLLKRYPNDANLGLVDRNCEELKELVVRIREQEPTKNVLRDIDRLL
ncbi:MAG: hypothetical protein R3C49_12980 [Planctomycetaceae bacterium]